jgi:geranylgeranyl pyrophosphate synthase
MIQTPAAALEAATARLLPRFEAALAARATWPTWPARLAEACRYALGTGGKRVRPLLTLLSAEAVLDAPLDGGEVGLWPAPTHADAALCFAVAVELVHTYSLVHDDLPAMDDDDERRGRPTCHRAFDEATAILAGDALLTEAFAALSEVPSPAALAMVRTLAAAAGGAGMVGGQVDDIAGGLDTLARLQSMQAAKTGALIAAAVDGGALAAGASASPRAALARYGAAVGRLFQVTDDLLDRAQDLHADGRPKGNSYLHFLPEPEVLSLRDALVAEALAALADLGPSADPLRGLAVNLQHRER